MAEKAAERTWILLRTSCVFSHLVKNATSNTALYLKESKATQQR